MFTCTLTFTLREGQQHHITSFRFNFKISDAMIAQCDVPMDNVINHSLLREFALSVVDQLRARDLFEQHDIRIEHNVCTDIFNELRHDPFLQTVIENFPLAVSDNIVLLISLVCQNSFATLNVSLHS